MVLTVKRAAEISPVAVKIAADGGEVVLGAGGIVPISSVGIGDVGTQFEVLAVKVVAAVHQRGQQVQASGCGDGVGHVLAAVGIVRDAPMVCPLGIEGDNIVIAHCEVRNILSVGVSGAGAIGLGVPSCEGVALAGEGVCGEVLCLVVSKHLVIHRAGGVDAVGGVGVKVHGVGIGLSCGGHCGVGCRHAEAPHALLSVDGGSRAACRGVARAGDGVAIGSDQRHRITCRSVSMSGGGADHVEICARHRDAVGRLEDLAVEDSKTENLTAIEVAFAISERLPLFHNDRIAVIFRSGNEVGGSSVTKGNGTVF